MSNANCWNRSSTSFTRWATKTNGTALPAPAYVRHRVPKKFRHGHLRHPLHQNLERNRAFPYARRSRRSKTDKLYAHVRSLNLESEGFYLVDHIMLRPRNAKNTYGIHFANRDKEIAFNSAKEFDFYDLQKNTVKLVYRLRKATRTISVNGQWLRGTFDGRNRRFGLHHTCLQRKPKPWPTWKIT